jgi:hypothetical protein
MARQLTENQQKFLEALFGEAKGNPATARRLAGYAPGISTKDIVSSLKDEILEATRLHLALHAPAAAMGIIGGLEDPTELGIKEKINAAKDILDRIGIVKTEKVQVEAGGGIMLLPPKQTSDE